MTVWSDTRRFDWCRTPATLLSALVFASQAHAATRGVSDSELIALGYLFLGIPIYVALMALALFTRYFEKSATGRTPSRTVRVGANLLPLAMAGAWLAYQYVVRPALPGHYSDVGFFLTWGCILAPLPLVLVANYLISRSPKLYQVASSWWWATLNGAAMAIVAVKMLALS